MKNQPTTTRSDGNVSLPVLPGTQASSKIKKSKNAPRRAAVLIIVQLLLIAHVIQWALMGRTISPIEPSESMEFTKHGIVNAGLIFFVLALLSTLIFGRWFCGWGCHVVMLQDGCNWFMKKIGIRPKPFRSRLLIYVPLLLALYMFIWPLFYRYVIAPWAQPDLPGLHISSQIVVDDFWATFPTVWVAIPFLAICGFATVYFLGAKGFCTYGCPYGGFFAPLDEFAVGRIRVNDNCEGCGHCTAVCTSNVRVHEEVREYGMVVDPGCMKCTDCVSVCPNDALYFGFGPSAHKKGAPKNKAPKKNYDLTWPEEIGLAVLFLGIFLAVRSIYGVVPLLMAAGVAGCLTFMSWKLWRMLRDKSVNLHRYRMKFKGRLRFSGWVFASVTVLLLAVTAHSGVIQTFRLAGWWHARQVQMTNTAFGEQMTELRPRQQQTLRESIDWYQRMMPVWGNTNAGSGFGLARSKEIEMRIAEMHCALLEHDKAQPILQQLAEEHPDVETPKLYLALIMRTQGRLDEYEQYCRQQIEAHPNFLGLIEEFMGWLIQIGRVDEAMTVGREALAQRPWDTDLLRLVSILMLRQGDPAEGIDLHQQIITKEPDNAMAYAAVAEGFRRMQDLTSAESYLRQALDHAPDDARLHQAMAELLTQLDRHDEAAKHRREAERLSVLHRSGGH